MGKRTVGGHFDRAFFRFLAELKANNDRGWFSANKARYLAQKDLYSMSRFSGREVCSPRFLDRYVDACARAAPLVELLTKALGLPW